MRKVGLLVILLVLFGFSNKQTMAAFREEAKLDFIGTFQITKNDFDEFLILSGDGKIMNYSETVSSDSLILHAVLTLAPAIPEGRPLLYWADTEFPGLGPGKSISIDGLKMWYNGKPADGEYNLTLILSEKQGKEWVDKAYYAFPGTLVFK